MACAILGLDIAPVGIVLMMRLAFLVLGMDWIGIVLLTMPVFLPIAKQPGYDPNLVRYSVQPQQQVAFLTPPFGSAAFHLKSVSPPEIDLVAIYRPFGPFICVQLVAPALVLFIPDIVLFLVR